MARDNESEKNDFASINTLVIKSIDNCYSSQYYK